MRNSLHLLTLSLALLWSYPAPQVAHYRLHGPAVLNDPSVTPGAVRTTDKKEVCSEGTKQFRHTTLATKLAAYRQYGVRPRRGVCAPACEVDHLISLELGGADKLSNLWPEPPDKFLVTADGSTILSPGWQSKDKVENWLHEQVCSGMMDLQQAQGSIARDWYAIYVGEFAHADRKP